MASGKILPFPQQARPEVAVWLWSERRRPDLEALQQELAAGGYQAVRWTSEAHQSYLAHAHIYAELLWLLEGSLTVILPEAGRLLELNPGDRVEIPAGTVHALHAGPEGAVYLVAAR